MKRPIRWPATARQLTRSETTSPYDGGDPSNKIREGLSAHQLTPLVSLGCFAEFLVAHFEQCLSTEAPCRAAAAQGLGCGHTTLLNFDLLRIAHLGLRLISAGLGEPIRNLCWISPLRSVCNGSFHQFAPDLLPCLVLIKTRKRHQFPGALRPIVVQRFVVIGFLLREFSFGSINATGRSLDDLRLFLLFLPLLELLIRALRFSFDLLNRVLEVADRVLINARDLFLRLHCPLKHRQALLESSFHRRDSLPLGLKLRLQFTALRALFVKGRKRDGLLLRRRLVLLRLCLRLLDVFRLLNRLGLLRGIAFNLDWLANHVCDAHVIT